MRLNALTPQHAMPPRFGQATVQVSHEKHNKFGPDVVQRALQSILKHGKNSMPDVQVRVQGGHVLLSSPSHSIDDLRSRLANLPYVLRELPHQ